MTRKRKDFHVIGGPAIRAVLHDRQHEVVALIRETYLLHHAGRATNPDSYFLRFPDKPTARIIALPARVQAGHDVAGIKWISSFPENLKLGIERASAIIVLNDMDTGLPYACLEGSYISAARTAASATVAAEILHQSKRVPMLAVIGAGPIAATVVNFLLATGWNIGSFRVYDLVAKRSASLCAQLNDRGCRADATGSAEHAIRGADLVVLATTAASPHLQDPALFTTGQTVLHLSLRDLGVSVILSGQNIVDDVEHCMKAQTSVHLAEQATGSRAFVAGTIGDTLTGRLRPDCDRIRIFSPFGLGVLDLNLARFVFEVAAANGQAIEIRNFFISNSG